jgi:hypothetical protein
MSPVEIAYQVANSAEAILAAIQRLQRLTRRLGWRLPSGSGFSYENLSLSLCLDIKDARGSRAVVTRKQRVLFLAGDAGIVTNPVWGDGNQFARFEALGASRLGARAEGPKTALLLSLDRRPVKGTRATIVSRRLITDGFPGRQEYFDAAIERPTRSLSVRILFPKSRPPLEAHGIEPGFRSTSLALRANDAGRPTVAWRVRRADVGVTYSLRWSW